jgi:hypothetical protein
MRSPTGTYAEGGHRWVYVGKTQVSPPEFYGKSRRAFKIGMIITVNPSNGEDIYVDSTDAESPRLERPREEESENEPEMEKEEYREGFKDEQEQDEPHPQNIIRRMRTTYPQPAEPTAEKQNWRDPLFHTPIQPGIETIYWSPVISPDTCRHPKCLGVRPPKLLRPVK